MQEYSNFAEIDKKRKCFVVDNLTVVCYMGAKVEVKKDAEGIHVMYMNITEVEEEEMPRTFGNSGRNCLPNGV